MTQVFRLTALLTIAVFFPVQLLAVEPTIDSDLFTINYASNDSASKPAGDKPSVKVDLEKAKTSSAQILAGWTLYAPMSISREKAKCLETRIENSKAGAITIIALRETDFFFARLYALYLAYATSTVAREGAKGTAELSLRISPDGTIDQIEFLKSDMTPRLSNLVLDMLKGEKKLFIPAQINGSPVFAWCKMGPLELDMSVNNNRVGFVGNAAAD